MAGRTGGDEGSGEDVTAASGRLGAARTRGELGSLIAPLVLSFSPRDLHRLMENFSRGISDVDPAYRERLLRKVREHLLGTYQRIRLMAQQGAFDHLREPVDIPPARFFEMVAAECRSSDGGEDRGLRFLKYLLAAFPIFVLGEPAHAEGTPFPGGDTVEFIQGVYYCPVREKANDVGGALCPFCPAVQTPAIGYLRPPLNRGEQRKQEFLRTTYDHHHFNG
jgi:uncharacterized protein (UPF0305 family)